MNVKNFIIGGIVGGIVNFLLGWLFWGELFKDFFPPHNENEMNMVFIFLGCMTFGFFISFIFNKWAGISSAITGAKGGAVFGLLLGLHSNFFQQSMTLTPDTTMMAVDVLLTITCGAIVGAVIGVVNGKLK
ncbi:hypothetical protein [Flavobacterium sp.]|uniref:hypothetical protein n=1 Tax=Flavobacterium sp. TaxID=239 RepID=UPI002618DF63|nr:hypothetical protein [Flavobacterium sp.]